MAPRRAHGCGLVGYGLREHRSVMLTRVTIWKMHVGLMSKFPERDWRVLLGTFFLEDRLLSPSRGLTRSYLSLQNASRKTDNTVRNEGMSGLICRTQRRPRLQPCRLLKAGLPRELTESCMVDHCVKLWSDRVLRMTRRCCWMVNKVSLSRLQALSPVTKFSGPFTIIR